jgi:hypothetical protein
VDQGRYQPSGKNCIKNGLFGFDYLQIFSLTWIYFDNIEAVNFRIIVEPDADALILNLILNPLNYPARLSVPKGMDRRVFLWKYGFLPNQNFAVISHN